MYSQDKANESSQVSVIRPSFGSPHIKWVSDDHTYAVPGTYTITLTVTDSSGASATATYQIIIVRCRNP